MLDNVPNGSLPLIATRCVRIVSGSGESTVLKMINIRRNQNFPPNAVIPNLDMSDGSTEAFAPVMKNLIINNLNGDLALTQLGYITANGGLVPLGSNFNSSGVTTRTFGTIPGDKQDPTDYYFLSAVTQTPFFTPTDTRFAALVFHAAADQTITLGPAVNALAPSILSASSTAPIRFRVAITTQPEYSTYFSTTFQQAGANPRFVELRVSAGWAGASASSVNLDIPDLSAAGYPAIWGLQPGVLTNYTTTAAGWSGTGGLTSTPYVEGASIRFASKFGSTTP